MKPALLLLALALGACASPAPPPVVAPGPEDPVKIGATTIARGEWERAKLAECAASRAEIERGNAILASRGSTIRTDADQALRDTACSPVQTPDSGVRYATPRPPPVVVVVVPSYRYRRR